PNPANSSITLTATDASKRPATLLDAQGRVVLSFTTTGVNTVIDVRSLTPGIYVLLVESADGVQRVRFVKE
ncbi:MAG TPA: T9SS type A sorting domain-containing protein, partial [Flavobacteriales bacterium]|nr:T9SS type A sorting domain-containing protein [Flavobacteriales bacterium]